MRVLDLSMKYKKERKDDERKRSKDKRKGKHSKSPKKKGGFGCAKTNSKNNNAACNE